MKIQDILFIVIIGFLLYKKNPTYLIIAGLLALVLSMPLFHLWVFFTAERLVWYAAAFILASIVLFGLKHGK